MTRAMGTLKIVAAVIVALGLAGATPALASGTFSGNMTGVFDTPVLSGDILAAGTHNPVHYDNTGTAVYTGIGTANASWGDNFGGAGAPSTVSFVGNAYTNQAPNVNFALGTLTYSNNTSSLGSMIFGLTLHIDAGAPDISQADFIARIVTTENGGTSASADADFLSVTGLPANAFHVLEGATASAIIYGKIVGDPQLVITGFAIAPGSGSVSFITPEPGTLLLLGAGAIGLAALRRRKR